MTSPAELQAIRERDAEFRFVDPMTPRLNHVAHDRRTLLALYDAQSDEVRRLRDALRIEHFSTFRQQLAEMCDPRAAICHPNAQAPWCMAHTRMSPDEPCTLPKGHAGCHKDINGDMWANDYSPALAPTSQPSRGKHEQRVIGHANGRQEYLNECVCGKSWPCPDCAQPERQGVDEFIDYLRMLIAQYPSAQSIGGTYLSVLLSEKIKLLQMRPSPPPKDDTEKLLFILRGMVNDHSLYPHRRRAISRAIAALETRK